MAGTPHATIDTALDEWIVAAIRKFEELGQQDRRRETVMNVIAHIHEHYWTNRGVWMPCSCVYACDAFVYRTRPAWNGAPLYLVAGTACSKMLHVVMVVQTLSVGKNHCALPPSVVGPLVFVNNGAYDEE